MLRVFFQTAAIFVIIGFGYLLRRRRVIDATFNRQLSLLLVYVFYPALIVTSLLRNYTWTTLLDNWPLPAGSAMILFCGWLIGRFFRPLLRRQSQSTRAMFHFQCMSNNYSFLPIMLAAMLLGSDGVSRIIFSTLGAELMVWTLGVQTLTGRRAHRAEVLRNLLSLPMMAMLTGALLLCLNHYAAGVMERITDSTVGGGLRDMLNAALYRTGEATIPVSAVIVGSRMAGLDASHVFSRLVAGATLLRLIAIPAVATTLILLLPFPSEIRPVLLLVAAQPCAMASVSLAEAYDSDASFATATVLTTHIFSLLTIPLWLAAPWWNA